MLVTTYRSRVPDKFFSAYYHTAIDNKTTRIGAFLHPTQGSNITRTRNDVGSGISRSVGLACSSAQGSSGD
jgi:hypothetical protein